MKQFLFITLCMVSVSILNAQTVTIEKMPQSVEEFIELRK
jgi:hypothetical protein